MKILLLFVLGTLSIGANSQDTLKLKPIDSLTKIIENAGYNSYSDSLKKIDTFGTMIMRTNFHSVFYYDDQKNLKKLRWANDITQETGEKKHRMNVVSDFYYWNDQLIKVDETATGIKEGVDSPFRLETYYSGDKILYYSSQSEKALSRSRMLLELSRTFFKQFTAAKENLPLHK